MDTYSSVVDWIASYFEQREKQKCTDILMEDCSVAALRATVINTAKTEISFLLRNHRESVHQCRRAIAIHPNSTKAFLPPLYTLPFLLPFSHRHCISDYKKVVASFFLREKKKRISCCCTFLTVGCLHSIYLHSITSSCNTILQYAIKKIIMLASVSEFAISQPSW